MRLPARCMEAMVSGRRMRRRGPFEMVSGDPVSSTAQRPLPA